MPPSGVFNFTMDEEALIEAEIAQELDLIDVDGDEEDNDPLAPPQGPEVADGEEDVNQYHEVRMPTSLGIWDFWVAK